MLIKRPVEERGGKREREGDSVVVHIGVLFFFIHDQLLFSSFQILNDKSLDEEGNKES
jgi:hypothetical protein